VAPGGTTRSLKKGNRDPNKEDNADYAANNSAQGLAVFICPADFPAGGVLFIIIPIEKVTSSLQKLNPPLSA